MHASSTLILVVAVFAASLVEMVEALTIVVAAGISRGWRPALEGAAAALLVLGVLVLVVGVPLIRYIPLDALRYWSVDLQEAYASPAIATKRMQEKGMVP